jgi:hypothetical protein
VLIKAQATSLTDGSMLFFLGDTLDSSPQFYCAITEQQTVDFEIYDSSKSSFYSLSGSTTVSVNAYADFEIAFVQDATAGQWLLFVNGNQQASMTIPSGFSFRANSTTVSNTPLLMTSLLTTRSGCSAASPVERYPIQRTISGMVR